MSRYAVSINRRAQKNLAALSTASYERIHPGAGGEPARTEWPALRRPARRRR